MNQDNIIIETMSPLENWQEAPVDNFEPYPELTNEDFNSLFGRRVSFAEEISSKDPYDIVLEIPKDAANKTNQENPEVKVTESNPAGLFAQAFKKANPEVQIFDVVEQKINPFEQLSNLPVAQENNETVDPVQDTIFLLPSGKKEIEDKPKAVVEIEPAPQEDSYEQDKVTSRSIETKSPEIRESSSPEVYNETSYAETAESSSKSVDTSNPVHEVTPYSTILNKARILDTQVPTNDSKTEKNESPAKNTMESSKNLSKVVKTLEDPTKQIVYLKDKLREALIKREVEEIPQISKQLTQAKKDKQKPIKISESTDNAPEGESISNPKRYKYAEDPAKTDKPKPITKSFRGGDGNNLGDSENMDSNNAVGKQDEDESLERDDEIEDLEIAFDHGLVASSDNNSAEETEKLEILSNVLELILDELREINKIKEITTLELEQAYNEFAGIAQMLNMAGLLPDNLAIVFVIQGKVFPIIKGDGVINYYSTSGNLISLTQQNIENLTTIKDFKPDEVPIVSQNSKHIFNIDLQNLPVDQYNKIQSAINKSNLKPGTPNQVTVRYQDPETKEEIEHVILVTPVKVPKQVILKQQEEITTNSADYSSTNPINPFPDYEQDFQPNNWELIEM